MEEALDLLLSGAMFSPEDICSPPGPVPPAAVSFAPARGQPLDHMEVCFLFLFVFFISRTDWEDLARVRTRDSGLHVERLGRGPESWDLQGSEGPGQFPSTLERSAAATALRLGPAGSDSPES